MSIYMKQCYFFNHTLQKELAKNNITVTYSTNSKIQNEIQQNFYKKKNFAERTVVYKLICNDITWDRQDVRLVKGLKSKIKTKKFLPKSKHNTVKFVFTPY